jgi:polysaccharide pyruvyl transferase WcaK-like protein
MPTSDRPLRLCLTGGWFSSSNVGDNALLAGICDSIRNRCAAEFVVLTSSPENVARAHGLPAFAPKKRPIALVRALCQADALAFTGGTPFYDDPAHMAYFAALTALARARGIPVIVFGISLRMISQALSRTFTRFICRSAAYLGAREDRTRQLLDDIAGQPGRARLLPDPATQMTPISDAEAEAELARMGATPGRPRVAICLRDFSAPSRFRSAHYSAAYTSGQREALLSAMARLSTHLVGERGARVVFLPMNTKAPDDDRMPARDVVDRVTDRGIRASLHVVQEQQGPRAVKGMLGRMDAVIGVRFHSLVLATSMGVPVYAVGYAPKNEAIMRFFGREAYAQSLSSFDADRLIDGVDEMLSDIAAQRRAIADRNAAINQLYQEELTVILNLVEKKRSGVENCPP